MATRKSRYRLKSSKKGGSLLGSRFIKFLLLTLILLIAAIIVAYMVLTNYVEGDKFRNQSQEQLNEISPYVQVDIDKNLQIRGSSLALPELAFQSKDAQQKLSLHSLELDLNRFALINRLFHVEEATLDKLDLTLDLDTLNPAALKIKLAGEQSSRFLPNKWQIDQFTINEASTRLILDGEVYSYSDYKLGVRPLSKDQKSWEMMLEGGVIKTPLFWLEKARIDAGKILIKPDSIRLEETTLALSPGELSLRGLYKMRSGDWLIRLRAKKAPIAHLLDNDWKKRITGQLDSAIELRGKEGKMNFFSASINVLQARAEALPFLSELSIANSYPYRSLGFDQASATLRFPYSSAELGISRAWLIEDIVLMAKDKLMVKGFILIKSNRGLSGTLDVGIPKSIHGKIPLFQILISQQIFSAQDKNGYCWTKVNLSGTLDQPREDLSARLKSILSKKLSQTSSGLIELFNSSAGSLLPSRGKASEPTPKDSPSKEKPPTLLDQGIKGSRQLVDEGVKLFF